MRFVFAAVAALVAVAPASAAELLTFEPGTYVVFGSNEFSTYMRSDEGHLFSAQNAPMDGVVQSKFFSVSRGDTLTINRFDIKGSGLATYMLPGPGNQPTHYQISLTNDFQTITINKPSGYGFYISSANVFTIDNVVVTSVPEPATWALMIAGFGAIGFRSRRRLALQAS